MARTKGRARRGPEGHAFRENAKKNAQSGSGSGGGGRGGGNGGKRKRNRGGSQIESRDGDRMEGSGAKRRKASDSGEGEGVEESVPDVQVEGDGITTVAAESEPRDASSTKAEAPQDNPANSSLSLPIPIFPGLEDSHTVTTMSIISSSHITKKVSRILELLSISPSSPSEEGEGNGKSSGKDKGRGKEKKDSVVMMYAKAPVVSKVVSVAEIVKREIGKEGGKWFSYCAVGEVIRERGEQDRNGKGGREKIQGQERGKENVDEGEGSEEEEEEAFELMKTPFERALESEGKPKVRAMPVMSLYLSRVRIEGLRKAYGEQTNAREVK
ncbi:hypothetical protein ACEPPN_009835 [Leptodophora sp. 'Broadleaf-Isolate-01']